MKNVLHSSPPKVPIETTLHSFAAKLAGLLTKLLYPGKRPAYQVIPPDREGSAADKLKNYRNRF